MGEITVTTSTVSQRVMWNRWIANPLEHYTDGDEEFPQPLCGRTLASERANFANQPTGQAGLCHRCESKHRQLEQAASEQTPLEAGPVPDTRDQPEKGLSKVEAERDALKAQLTSGELHVEQATKFRRTFAHVPGLSQGYNPRLTTTDEVLAAIENMSATMQRLFDRVHELEAREIATDSMLAGAGELFLRMSQAAQTRRDVRNAERH